MTELESRTGVNTNSKRVGWFAVVLCVLLLWLSTDGSLWQGYRVAQLRLRLSAFLIAGLAIAFLWDCGGRPGIRRHARSTIEISPPPISVEQLAPPVTLVRLRGRHDPSTTHRIRRSLTGREPIIVDLSEASFIDASVVDVLASAHARTALVVVCPQGTQPRRVLDMARAGDSMPVVDTQPAAREMVGAEASRAARGVPTGASRSPSADSRHPPLRRRR
jgi:anti-anti-sigma regulatory factor